MFLKWLNMVCAIENMKTKLICIISLLLLCGCNESVFKEDQPYRVYKCLITDDPMDGPFIVEAVMLNAIGGEPVGPCIRFRSNSPFTVGKSYRLTMNELK